MSEFVYVLENPSMPGLVKIGRTDRSVSERVNELSSHTGVPTGFAVVKHWAVTNSVEAERIIHERLSDYRVADNREFFKMEAEDATDIIESILGTAKPERQDFEREDELVARAIPIVVKQGTARPRMLEEMLGISYEEALFVIHVLRGRGVIGEHNESTWKVASHPPAVAPNAVPPVISPVPEPESVARISWLPAAPGEETDAAEKPPEPKPQPEVRISGLPAAPAAASKTKPPRRSKPITVASTPMIGNYHLPPLDFLQHPSLTTQPTELKEDLMAKARLIQQTLAQFDIEVALGDITRGPTITRYELHPAPGVVLEEIAALNNNLAAALKAERLHILAPIPGKSTVGVEVPNPVRMPVIIRDLLESEEWRNTKARIPLALGKDVYGHPIISDLSEMPHVLIAGGVGSGKSVLLDAIITSLLYRFSPDQLRFVMIDPNVIELQQYDSLPHLVVPVVTDPKKVILALRWVVNEIEKRYQIFARVGVRNVLSFNSRPKNKSLPPREPELPLLAKKVEPGSDGFAVEVDEEIVVPREEDIIIPEKLSYIVVIIDELADLMLVAPADVEMAIARITQMARAAGCHFVVATRQANLSTVSEIIKANIPARIAFRCESRLESRHILDTAGAEKLLGKGDLLYLPPGSLKLIRAQGPLITCHETQSVVEFIAKQARPSYELEIHQQLSRAVNGLDDESGIDEDEEIIQDCIEVIRSEQKASVSLLQRRLRLAYGRAARIMDELENRGIVGPSNGAEPRDILIDLDGRGADGPPPQGVGSLIDLEPGHLEATPDEQPPVTQPHLAVCLCQHCSGKIEFDANELGGRQSVVVPCPHCGAETVVS
jgi:S-DNA-T family DNA segregation ATPase FtsK/SpoIIIE